MLKTKELLSLDKSLAGELLSSFTYPWQALSSIKGFILEIGKSLPEDEYTSPAENVWIHKSAVVAPTAYIGAPCIIGENTEVRHCAFIRGSALIGKNCVVGNSTEIKNAILFDNVQVPHYNYVGDSILGYKSHMGAGSVTSNVKSDKTLVVLRSEDERYETGLKKFGAVLGDYVEVGCNSVLNPGTVIGRNTNIYPLSSVRGEIPADSIYKSAEKIVYKE
ncbi:MAG: UDP-N-acetylglucosamine pyrophosphorylase [Clostridia bacterium]|nr:UDP-N-acetylglucosamine pyrophosphorylase [Clostridia bacterium]